MGLAMGLATERATGLANELATRLVSGLASWLAMGPATGLASLGTGLVTVVAVLIVGFSSCSNILEIFRNII